MKNQGKRYSEETYLKFTICTALYLLHENITKKGFILRNKRDAWRWRDWIFEDTLKLIILMIF